jgi:thiol-disulfide isomerase/thioredoxin
MTNAVLISVIAVLSLVVVLNFTLTLAMVRRMGTRPNNVSEPLKKGIRFPDFKAHTLSGSEVSRTDFAGRRILFLFAKPGCQPCIDAIPTWEQLVKRAPTAAAEVALVMDGVREDVESMLKEHPFSGRVLLAPSGTNSMFPDWNIFATPIFVQTEGEMVKSSGVVMPTSGAWQDVVRWFDSARDLAPSLARA